MYSMPDVWQDKLLKHQQVRRIVCSWPACSPHSPLRVAVVLQCTFQVAQLSIQEPELTDSSHPVHQFLQHCLLLPGIMASEFMQIPVGMSWLSVNLVAQTATGPTKDQHIK